jgi:regulator of cell morphogenesis and NO signaling
MQSMEEKTLGEIVAEDFRAAAVLTRHKLDFCCRGGRKLSEACREKGVDPATLLEDLQRTRGQDAGGGATNRFSEWPLPLLVDYVLHNHHDYLKKSMPILTGRLEKLQKVHGSRHSELFDLGSLFRELAEDLHQHMWKEENVLFPYIKRLASGSKEGSVPKAPFASISTPVQAMRTEHEREGGRLVKLRELTSDFTPPADGCATYRVTFQELEALERDLFQHIHIENNILFPAAERLEKAGVLLGEGRREAPGS